MIATEHRVFRATLGELPETAAFVEGFCNLHVADVTASPGCVMKLKHGIPR